MEERKRLGKFNKDVVIPVAPDVAEFGKNYESFIHSVIDEVKKRRIQIVLQANQAMLLLYWHIGKTICEKQKEEGWGTKVIDRISRDLQKTFPDMKGFSPRNIKYMKKFATLWQDETIVQQLVAQLPWGDKYRTDGQARLGGGTDLVCPESARKRLEQECSRHSSRKQCVRAQWKKLEQF